MANLWTLHSLSASYGQRPSSFLGLAPDSWDAWQVDVATLQAGRYVENKLAERDKDGRPRHTLEELIGEGRGAKEQRFGALGMKARKVTIRDDGTWE